MDNNEKELEVGGFQTDIPNENTINNNESVNENSVNPDTFSNVFMYGAANSTPVGQSVSANPFNYVDDSVATESPVVENAFVYTDTPVEAATSDMNKVEDQFAYTDLKDMPQNNVEEAPKYNPPTPSSSTSNYDKNTSKDEKGNFGFMIIFAIIMIAIIFALPYIAGYK